MVGNNQAMFLIFLTLLAQAHFSILIVNNTRVEFDVGAPFNPYVANEFVFNPDDKFGLILEKNKFRVGLRYKVNDFLKADPHFYIQHQRESDWGLEYGPTLRLDLSY
jgi:hypothetical protein